MESKILPELRKEGGEQMSNTVNLIIEIHKPPKNDHERWALTHGTPLEDIKTEIKELHNLPLIRVVSAGAAVDTCLEIIDKHTSGEGANE